MLLAYEDEISRDLQETATPHFLLRQSKPWKKIRLTSIFYITREHHYNTHFGVHSDISVIIEQPYNEDLIQKKYISSGSHACRVL